MKREIHSGRRRQRLGRRSSVGGPGKPLDFNAVNRAVLPQLLSLLLEWLPAGQCRGNEYVVKNPRRLDRHPGSFKINVVSGAWADFAVEGARGGDPVSLYAYLNDISQSKAALRLARLLEITDA